MIRDIIKEVRRIPMGHTRQLVRAGWEGAINAIENRLYLEEAEQLKRLMDDTASDDGDYGASITE